MPDNYIKDRSTDMRLNTVFGELQDRFSAATHDSVQLTSVSPKDATACYKAFGKHGEMDYAKHANLETGLYLSAFDQFAGKMGKPEMCKLGRLHDLWTNASFTLAKEWGEAEFIKKASDAYRDCQKARLPKERRERVSSSPVNQAVYGDDSLKPTKYPILKTFINLNKWSRGEADDVFLYSRLRADLSGNLYWHRRFSKQKETPNLSASDKEVWSYFNDLNDDDFIPVYVDNGQIKDSPRFWSAFLLDQGDYIEHAIHAIPQRCEELRIENNVENGLPVQTVEETLSDEFPLCLLAAADLVEMRREYKDKDGEKRSAFVRFDISWKAPENSLSSVGTQNSALIASLSKTMLNEAYFKESEVSRLHQCANVRGKGFTFLDIDGIDKTGKNGTRLALDGGEPPALPPKWSSFIFGADGAHSIFPNDPRMCLLRLAYFVAALMDANEPQIRQALYLCGNGEDGKTTLMTMIQATIGKSAYASLSGDPSDWVDSKSYALMHKVLCVIPETQCPDKVLSSALFKAITGGGQIQLRKLFKMATEYQPEKLLFAVCTNCEARIEEPWMASRLLPIGMAPNYEFGEKRKIVSFVRDAYEERTQFLQWCFDMVGYYKHLKRADGRPFSMIGSDGLLVVTDEDFNDLLKSAKDLTSQEVQNKREIAIDLMGRTSETRAPLFYVVSQSESRISIDECIKRLITSLNIEKKDGAKLRSVDLAWAIAEFAQEDKYKKKNRQLVLEAGLNPDSRIAQQRAFGRVTQILSTMYGVKRSRNNEGTYFQGICLPEKTDTASTNITEDDL